MKFIKKSGSVIAVSLIIVFLLFSSAHAVITFERAYGGYDFEGGMSVKNMPAGGYVIAGYTWSYGAGRCDAYLIRTDSLGDTLWTRTYGGSEMDWAYSIQIQDDGGFILAGVWDWDFCLIRTDSLGNMFWVKTYGGSLEEWAYAVQNTPDGGFVIVGHTYSYGAGNADIYLVRTDSLGEVLWTKTYGGGAADYGYDIQIVQGGGYIITGETYSYGTEGDVYIIRIDSLGDEIWTKNYGGGSNNWGYSIQNTQDGGFIITGQTYSYFPGKAFWHRDAYLLKITLQGDSLWARAYGDTGHQAGYSVQNVQDGGFIIAGKTCPNHVGELIPDVYLIRMDSLGDLLWTRTYGGSSYDYCHSVQNTPDGGFIIAGHTRSYSADPWEYDVYLIKTDSEGNVGVKETFNYQPSISNYQLSVYPNPFTSTTTVTVFLPSMGQRAEGIEIKIFDVGGREVKHFLLTTTVVWDGRDEQGKEVAPGMYFIKVVGATSGLLPITKKVVVIR